MQDNTDFQAAQANRESAALDIAKINAVTRVLGLTEGILGRNREFGEHRTRLKADKLGSTASYELQDRLNAFLIGSGQTGVGFLSEILAANDKEEFRQIVIRHDSGLFPSDPAYKATVDQVVEVAKSLMSTYAWMDLQFVLPESTAAPIEQPSSYQTLRPSCLDI